MAKRKDLRQLELNVLSNQPKKVGLRAKLKDFNALYTGVKNKRVVQEIIDFSNPLRMSLKEILYKIVPNDEALESYPVCEQGCTCFEEHLGEICNICGTTVEYPAERSLAPTMWLTKPYGIDKFINPYVFDGLMDSFNLGTHNNPYNPLAYYLTGRNHYPKREDYHRAIIGGIHHEPGWNNTVANFRELIVDLVRRILELDNRNDKDSRAIIPRLKESNRLKLQDALDLLRFKSDLLFSDVLPVRNKLTLILETGLRNYRIPSTQYYAEAITELANMPTTEEEMKQSKRNTANTDMILFRCYTTLTKHTEAFVSREGSKEGGMRGEILGGRSTGTTREVISALVCEHACDEISLPYSASVIILGPWLRRSYLAEGWTKEDIDLYLSDYTRVFSEELHQRMTKLLYEFSDEGMEEYIVRFPTLYRLSGQFVYSKSIKRDPNDRSLSVPAGCLKGCNGDFDGDRKIAA